MTRTLVNIQHLCADVMRLNGVEHSSAQSLAKAILDQIKESSQ